MTLPSTQPLDGEFWYVLDNQNQLVWKPRPRVRGDFYLGWLGQDKVVVGAGLVHLAQGQLLRICTHGTPYYWLQPYEALPVTHEALQAHQMLGADTVQLDFTLAGWGMRDRQPPPHHALPDTPVSVDELLIRLHEIGIDKSKDTIQRYCREGDLDCEKLGMLRRYFATEVSVEKLIEKLQPDAEVATL